MSLRVAATTSTSSTFATSSTTTTTPVTPHASAGSAFHVFRATASPPPVLGNGSFSISRKHSVPPSTPALTSPNVSIGDIAKDAENNSANGAAEQSKGKEKERPPSMSVDVEAAGEEARQRGRRKGRREEEVEVMSRTAARFAASLAADHKAISQPDVETPFADAQDVVRRLLPYHIFLQPSEDLQTIMHSDLSGVHVGKGKRKATEEDLLKEEIAETKFALECWKRKTALEKRFRRARIAPGKRLAPDDQAYTLAHILLDSERTDLATLQAEYRSNKAEWDRIGREKKAAAAAAAATVPSSQIPATNSRTSYYPPTSTTVSTAPTRASTPASSGAQSNTPTQTQSAYRPPYRAYSYPYQQTFQQYTYPAYSANNVTVNSHATATSTSPTQPSTNSFDSTFSSVSIPTAPIPVQLPASSLASLAALGIVPVPAENAPPADQPQPAAVLKGTTQNGTMVSLEINVSALGAAQASGLAVLLSALTSRTMPVGVNGTSVGAPLAAISSMSAVGVRSSVTAAASASRARQNSSADSTNSAS